MNLSSHLHTVSSAWPGREAVCRRRPWLAPAHCLFRLTKLGKQCAGTNPGLHLHVEWEAGGTGGGCPGLPSAPPLQLWQPYTRLGLSSTLSSSEPFVNSQINNLQTVQTFTSVHFKSMQSANPSKAKTEILMGPCCKM